jgi:hypothetical protein
MESWEILAHRPGNGDFCWATLMQDWVLISAPLALTLYFLAFQDQFRALLSWLGALVN